MTTPTEFEHWTKLSPEMKLVCVKHMDFLQRLRLRSTSTTERNLIDMHRFPVEELKISDDQDGIILEITVNSEEKFKIMAADERIRDQQLVPFLAYVLRNGRIDLFQTDESKEFPESCLAVLRDIKRCRIDKFKFRKIHAQNLIYLEKADAINTAMFGVFDDQETLDKCIDLHSLSRTPKWRIRGSQVEAMMRVVRKWIEMDFDIGSRMEMKWRENKMWSAFKIGFEDRIVNTDEMSIRIRTDNPKKHVLLQKDEKLFIIPSEMKNGSDEMKEFTKENIRTRAEEELERTLDSMRVRSRAHRNMIGLFPEPQVIVLD